MKMNLKTICAYCGYPFGQGDHDHCLLRLPHLQFVNPKDQADVGAHSRYLRTKGFKAKAKMCWCGETFHWRGKQCHAHTRAWRDKYGGRLRTKHAHLAAKQGVSKARRRDGDTSPPIATDA